MTDDALTDMLQRNTAHYETHSDGHFDAVQDGQQPDMVSICCADSRVSQEGMFSITKPGTLFTPSNIGNQAWDEVDGEKVVNGNLLYPVAHTGTKTIVVVGHTSCGAVTATYQHVTEGIDEPAGIQRMINMLEPVVVEAIELNVVDTDDPDDKVINQLVEYNVDQQVQFLRNNADIPDDATVYGMVYDFQSVYGGEKGKLYLINIDGETDTEALTEHVPEELQSHVKRLTDY